MLTEHGGLRRPLKAVFPVLLEQPPLVLTQSNEKSVCEIPTAVPCHLDKSRGWFSEAVSLPLQEYVDLFIQGQKPSPRHALVLCCAFCGDS